MRQKTKNQIVRVFVLYLPLFLFMAFIVFPLLWAMSLSFRDGASIISKEFRFLPKSFIIDNYVYVWNTVRLSQFFKNSLITSFGCVFFVGIMSLMNGYALSRIDFGFKRPFMIVLLMTQMVPMVFNISAIFILMTKLNLNNSLFGIILLHIAASLPYNSLMMKSFISGVPREIDEAASLDGCNQVQTLWHVILPAVRPGFVTVIAYSFITCWNEYLVSYTLLTDASKFPISVGLKYLQGEFSTDYGALAAGCVIALVPPIMLFAYVQRHLVEGMNAGAVKG